ncbi:MAG: Cof-type HAD-IIB family hydrolase [Candidatus Bipolaricaulaceae bacterium]
MKFELFAFDLDGTLLRPDGTISSETKDFLRLLKKSSRITLATGRSLSSSWPYIEELAIKDPVVLYHGAAIFHPQGKSVLREARLPPELARFALKVAAAFPVEVQLYRAVDDPHIYVERISPAILVFSQKENLPVKIVPELEKMAAEWPLKLLFIGPEGVLEELRGALRGIEATVVRSERNYLEVLPPGVSKGAGLAWLCEWLGVPLAKVVAVGDQESDVSMFERVGLAVAMAHAPEPVRRKAKVVVQTIPELQSLIDSFGFPPP